VDEVSNIKRSWYDLTKQMSSILGQEPDLNALLFLIGLQESGQGYRSYSKEEKQDLMHIGTCSILIADGYYRYNGNDEDGWPVYEQLKPLPAMNLKDQDLMLRKAVIQYFKERQ
jgi:hypothetical protein